MSYIKLTNDCIFHNSYILKESDNVILCNLNIDGTTTSQINLKDVLDILPFEKIEEYDDNDCIKNTYFGFTKIIDASRLENNNNILSIRAMRQDTENCINELFSLVHELRYQVDKMSQSNESMFQNNDETVLSIIMSNINREGE